MKSKKKAQTVMIVGIIVILVVIVILIFGILKLKNSSSIEDVYTFYNTGNTATIGMEPINTEINLGDLLQNVKNKAIENLQPVKDEDANMLLNLEEYLGLEKRIAKYETENEYTEIWLLKISQENQAIDIFRMFNNRILDLKKEFGQNERINEILNNEKNISMKQQNGIVVIIVSNNLENVENAIDECF